MEAVFIARLEINSSMNNMIGTLQMLWLMKSPPALFSRLYKLPWYRGALELWVAPIHNPNAKVLEVGCAGGDFSRALAALNMKVWAVDRSLQMLARARQTASNVQFKHADATRLPFSDQYFDIVIASSLLNVVDSPVAVLAEMRRVCRMAGTVSVLVPNQEFSEADANSYLEAAQLTGFSRAAFLIWHRLGKKMSADVLHGYFKDCGMTDITTGNFLGGMAVAIYGRVGKLGG